MSRYSVGRCSVCQYSVGMGSMSCCYTDSPITDSPITDSPITGLLNTNPLLALIEFRVALLFDAIEHPAHNVIAKAAAT